MRTGLLFALCVVLVALPALSGEVIAAEDDWLESGNIGEAAANNTGESGNISVDQGFQVILTPEHREVQTRNETKSRIGELAFNLCVMGAAILVIHAVQASLIRKRERALKRWDQR